jgi:hypothetical protein
LCGLARGFVNANLTNVNIFPDNINKINLPFGPSILMPHLEILGINSSSVGIAIIIFCGFIVLTQTYYMDKIMF